MTAGALTGAYRLGYQRRSEGGANATLYPPADPQGRWLYLNGVAQAAEDEAVAS